MSYPSWFARGTLFDQYPFLLPNLVCAVILAFGVLIGILFLEETHELKKSRPDVGLEIGLWILKPFRTRKESLSLEKADGANVEEARSLLEEDLPPDYRSREGSPRYPLSRDTSPDAGHNGYKAKSETTAQTKTQGAQKAFTKQVILNIIGYGLLA